MSEATLRAEDAQVQQLIDAAQCADQEGEEALGRYIAKLRCDLIDERKRMLFIMSKHEAERGSVLVAMCVATLFGAAVGAAVATALWHLWLGR